MGTTADKLQAVLKVKNALKTKFNLADDLPFSKYPENINASAPSPDQVFYKCTAVTQSSPIKFYLNSNGSDDECMRPGEYWKSDYNFGTGSQWGDWSDVVEVWSRAQTVSESGICYLIKRADTHYYFTKLESGAYCQSFKSQTAGAPNPWSVTEWVHMTTGEIGTFSVREEVDVYRSWQGSPIIMNENGEYEVDPDGMGVELGFSSDTSIVPVVGGIYDFDVKISIDKMHKNLTGAGGLFLCTYVNRNYFSYNTIVVSGMPTAPFVGCTYVNEETWETADVPEDIAARDPNGTYTLQNPHETVNSWYWENENGCVIDRWDMGSGQPIIYPGKDYKNTNKYIYVESMMGEIPQYPVPDDYTSFEWTYCSGSGSDTVVSGGSVSAVKPAEVEKYWEGLALQKNDDGKYFFAAETSTLAYGDYMPVAGRFYNGSCDAEITHVDLSEEANSACPTDMTSVENDDWLISTNGGEGYEGQAVWQAFDSDESTRFFSSTSNLVYIQWQNKKRPVLIKKIEASGLQEGYTYILSGSDDGVSFFEIYKGYLDYGSNGFEIPDNGKAYYYHRLMLESTGQTFTCNMIKAFSQIPREVPK